MFFSMHLMMQLMWCVHTPAQTKIQKPWHALAQLWFLCFHQLPVLCSSQVFVALCRSFPAGHQESQPGTSEKVQATTDRSSGNRMDHKTFGKHFIVPSLFCTFMPLGDWYTCIVFTFSPFRQQFWLTCRFLGWSWRDCVDTWWWPAVWVVSR